MWKTCREIPLEKASCKLYDNIKVRAIDMERGLDYAANSRDGGFVD